jgi:Zn-dependent alcohol dehydrogenase
MKAAILEEPGAPLRVDDVALEEPRAGEVLVKVEAAGVCHSDYHYMLGHLKCPTPIVLGHEGAGVVERAGPGVTRVREGDPVVLMWRPRCGHCRQCAAGRPAQCELGRVLSTAWGLLDGTTRLRSGEREVHHFLGVSCFAERCVVAEQSVLPIPAGIEPGIAAVVGCAVITGLGAVLNVVGEAAGKSVLVLGAGGVGLSCVMGARLAGAHPIVVADLAADKLALAAELGATHCVDGTADDVAAAVREICPDGVDWALEAIGLPETIERALECLAVGGTAVAIGLGDRRAAFSVRLNQLVQREVGIRGSLYGSSNTTVDIPRILDLHRSGRLPLDRLLGRSYPLDAINEAYDALAAGAVGRAVVVP